MRRLIAAAVFLLSTFLPGQTQGKWAKWDFYGLPCRDEIGYPPIRQNTWRFGEEDEWALNQDDGELIFTFSDGTVASSPAQIIGTHDADAGTWMWAWNNASIAPALTAHAKTVRQHGEQEMIPVLCAPTCEATEADAWLFTAVAVKLCDAQGAYRGPAGTTGVFMSFGDVRLSRG